MKIVHFGRRFTNWAPEQFAVAESGGTMTARWNLDASQTKWRTNRRVPLNQCSGKSNATTSPNFRERPTRVGHAGTIALRFFAQLTIELPCTLRDVGR
eukprot:370817-Lingulodinium_polyedra.AAC.1